MCIPLPDPESKVVFRLQIERAIKEILTMC